jgi:signal transduction histidine kinase
MTHGTAETSVSSVATIAPAHALAVMVAKIGCIIFVVEILIMIGLYGLDDAVTLGEGMFDATILTLVASPLIYLWVARPFADDAAAAREKLATQLSETRNLLDQNVVLKDRLQEFSAASADIHEQTLQRIGAELHDGPAQALTFSLLQVDRLLRALERDRLGELKSVTLELRQVIQDSAREIRGISTGLALPELRAMSLQEVVNLAVQRHALSTGRTAEVKFRSSYEASQSHKACIYRVVQESLANATKHSKAERVTVTVEDKRGLTVIISDDGQGFEAKGDVNKGLGLLGMRARVEALRGRFDLRSSPHEGTAIVAHFDDPVQSTAGHHDGHG